jgi:hypothetical protein
MGNKYFIDTEFIEGFHKPRFGKRRHFIDLISIGVVCEDGREYYAVSTDFNPKDADKWVKENVIAKLPARVNLSDVSVSPRLKQESLVWMPQKMIVPQLLEFFKCEWGELFYYAPEGIEIYGYFADYDWVLFCSLFGRMIDLPKGFPMYCKDLKQMMDDKGLDKEWKQKNCPDPEGEHNALVDAKWNRTLYKKIIEVPSVERSVANVAK